ncbi:TPA: hypothetical protein ACXJGQ_004189 [Serratia marcescens]
MPPPPFAPFWLNTLFFAVWFGPLCRFAVWFIHGVNPLLTQAGQQAA